MAGGTRSELASSSPEGSTFITSYPNGQRGSYGGPIMERSGSFRESLDSRVSSSGSAVARSPTHATTAEFPPLSSSLMLEPLSLGDQKYTRCGELRRVLGVSLEEHPFGSLQSKPLAPIPPEELKHFKVGLQEVSARARDRAKICHESILRVDKYRNHFTTRKRSRLETTAFEKSVGMPRTVNQSHQNPSDPILQRLEERTKNVVPNKRVRSSIAELRSEGRANSLLRQGAIMEKDKNITEREKNMLRACNGGANLNEDKNRFLSTGGDGLDNKMKRKRSIGPSSTRVMDSEREVKQGMQQRVKTEPRPRPSDGVGFRPNSSTAVIGVNKLDGTSQQIFGGSRALPKSDFDNSALVNDRREQSSLFEKDRSIAKGTNKLSVREDSLSGSQSPLTKGKASRAPRTGSASIINSSSVRTPGGLDGWEQPHSFNKSQPLTAPNNRKRSLSTGPSPPHVAQWVGQRPQKIRMRRTNLVSPVSGQDESQTAMAGSPASDAGARLPSSDAGVSVLSKVASGVSYLSNMTLENVNSPAILSESEESGAAENKYKERGINNGEDGALHAVRKVSSLLLPIKKNRPPKEESGDGVRRLGRSGRGLPHSKQALSSMKEKLENIHTTKLMRNGRPTSDRTESKVGRPPSKKVGDRKAFARPGHVVNSGSAELIAECEDDHDELFAAATYAQTYSDLTCPNFFWKTVSPYFASVDSKSLALLKQQIVFAEEVDGILCIDIDNKDDIVHQVGGTFETDDWFKRVVPLSQRLLAAIIPDYDTDCKNGQREHDLFSRFGSVNSYESRCLADSEGKDSENIVEFESELEMTFQSQKIGSRDNSCNGYVAPSNFRSQVTNNYSHFNGLLDGKSAILYSESIHSENIQNSVERMHSVGADYSGIPPLVFRYEHMSLEEKISLELQSIGLQPETVPDLSDGEDEQIDRDISELKMKLYQQARCRKTGLIKLDKAVQNARVLEERKLEHIAMDKLVETAYKKFQGGRGHHGSKGINKVSKQAALAFGKRTLVRCHKFESTEHSCFSELPLRNILFSSSPFSGNAKPKNLLSGDAIYAELQASNPSSDLAGHGIVCHRLDRSLGDPLQGLTQTSDQFFAKPETVQCRGKKREVSLGDVVGNAPLRHISTVGNSIPGGAKGKRSERERDQGSSARNSVAKIGRPSTGPLKGERKAKPKLKQKTAQLSTSGILLGRHTETDMSPLVHESPEAKHHWNNKGNERASLHHSGSVGQDLRKEIEETIDLSNLPLQPIDSIDELGGEVQDFGSWLNVDEEMLPDNDINGLDIPMDDLTELEMNF